MSKYTRSLPLPIISLLNERRDLIYNKNFPNMVMAGHALCVSKAKRTALACAHDEAQSSKRKTIGFYKDPVSSAEDITYGLLAYYYLQDSHVAIEQFMDAFDVFVDSVPALESASVSSVQSARVNEHEALSVSESETRANVSEAVSERVSVREREHAVEGTPEKASETASGERKTKTKTTTEKRKKNAKTANKSKAKKAQMDDEKKKVAKLIARSHMSVSKQDNPKISIPHPNKEALEVYAYLRSLSVLQRSNVIVGCIDDDMMHDEETQKRALTFDDTAGKAIQLVVNQRALKAFPPLSTTERATLVRVIYDKYVKGAEQQ